MTFNLRFGLSDDGPDSWKFRKESVAELFRAIHPDFICFQEANPFQSEFLASMLKEYRYIGKYIQPSPLWQDNIIFFSKDWTCIRYEHLFLSETPEKMSSFSGSKWPRQAVFGIFRKKGKHLCVVNTHFDFDPEVKAKSASLIIDVLRNFDTEIPMLVAGDFNADFQSRAYEVFMEGGFANSLNKVNSHTSHGFEGKGKSGVIDWILYKGNISLSSSKIITDKFLGRYPSDHYPVYAEFILN